MSKITITFDECEHTGDMDMYYGDIQDAGGKADWNSITIDHDAEVGTIEVEVDDYQSFLTRFMKTDAFGFSNLQ
jgi:hypothetical protein